MRDLWETVAVHSSDHGGAGFEDDAKQSHSVLVNRETTSRDRTPFLSTRTWEHDDAGHASAESPLGVPDVQYNIRTPSGLVGRLPSGPGELRGCRREHGFYWEGRNSVPLKVQGQVKGVDQEVYLQLIYEIGQRPENQVAALGLVSRTESGIGRTSNRVSQHS